MYVFAFAHTHKDINYAASGGELTPKEIRNFFFIKNNALDLHGCQGWIMLGVNQGYLVQAHQVIGYANPPKSSLSSSKFLITKAVKIGYKCRIEVVGKLVVFLNHVGAVPHGPIGEHPE